MFAVSEKFSRTYSENYIQCSNSFFLHIPANFFPTQHWSFTTEFIFNEIHNSSSLELTAATLSFRIYLWKMENKPLDWKMKCLLPKKGKNIFNDNHIQDVRNDDRTEYTKENDCILFQLLYQCIYANSKDFKFFIGDGIENSILSCWIPINTKRCLFDEPESQNKIDKNLQHRLRKRFSLWYVCIRTKIWIPWVEWETYKRGNKLRIRLMFIPCIVFF